VSSGKLVFMVNAAGCVCVCPVLLHALKIALPCYAVLYFSYSILLCAVVLVLKWRRCLVAGATIKTTGKRSKGVGRTKNSPGGGGGSK